MQILSDRSSMLNRHLAGSESYTFTHTHTQTLNVTCGLSHTVQYWKVGMVPFLPAAYRAPSLQATGPDISNSPSHNFFSHWHTPDILFSTTPVSQQTSLPGVSHEAPLIWWTIQRCWYIRINYSLILLCVYWPLQTLLSWPRNIHASAWCLCQENDLSVASAEISYRKSVFTECPLGLDRWGQGLGK